MSLKQLATGYRNCGSMGKMKFNTAFDRAEKIQDA